MVPHVYVRKHERSLFIKGYELCLHFEMNVSLVIELSILN